MKIDHNKAKFSGKNVRLCAHMRTALELLGTSIEHLFKIIVELNNWHLALYKAIIINV